MEDQVQLLADDADGATRALDASGRPVAADRAARALAALAWAPILGRLPPSDQRLLARAAVCRVARKGDVLLRRGEECRALSVLESGAVKIAADSPQGHSLPVALVGPGDLVGTSAVADHKGSAYTATAIEDSQLVSLPRQVLRRVLADRPEAARQLRSVLDQRQQSAAAVTGSQRRLTANQNGRVVSVHSPRGGAGTTTIAVNLAQALARERPRHVVLVDLALPFNQCAVWTQSVPTTSLARTTQAPADHREDILLSGIYRLTSGLGLLTGVLRPEEADLMTAELIAQCLQVLRREFAYVVLDVGTHLLPLVRATLERSDHVLLATTPDLLALRDVVYLRQSMRWLTNRTHVVVNHPTPTRVLDDEAIRRTLSVEALTDLGHDRSIMRAIARGEIMSRTARSSLARAVDDLASKLTSGAQTGRGARRSDRHGRSRWILG